MEDQTCTVTKSPTSAQTEPPESPVLEQAAKEADTVPDVMGAVGVESALNSVVERKSETVGSEMGVKKRRGRPRKYDVNGNLLSPASAPPGFSNYSFGSSVKRSRGRPRGSGKLQLLASIGGLVADTAGGSFTPHVVTVNTGEDVVSGISSFSLRGPRAVCILSATGAVSSVIIRRPGSSGGVLRYEGCFEILSLSGSYIAGGIGGGRRKSGMLSVSLAKPDGRVFGGGVEGSLMAAGPIQLVVASFKQNISKEIKRRYSAGSSAASNMPGHPDSVRVPLQVPKMIKGEQLCPSPTSGLVPTTNGLPDKIIPATSNGLPDNVIPATTNGLSDNVISATTSGIPDNVIPASQNRHSASSNGISLDCQAMQPIADHGMSTDTNTSVPRT